MSNCFCQRRSICQHMALSRVPRFYLSLCLFLFLSIIVQSSNASLLDILKITDINIDISTSTTISALSKSYTVDPLMPVSLKATTLAFENTTLYDDACGSSDVDYCSLIPTRRLDYNCRWNCSIPTLPMNVFPAASLYPPDTLTAIPDGITSINISLGVLLPFFLLENVTTDLYLQFQQEARESLILISILQDWIANDISFWTVLFPSSLTGTVPVNVFLEYRDDACDPTSSVIGTIDLIDNNSDFAGLIGPACTAGAQPSNLVASYNRIPQISYRAAGDEMSSRQTYPYFYRVGADLSMEVSAVFSLMKVFNWNHLGAMILQSTLGQGLSEEIRSQSSALGIPSRIVTYRSGTNVTGLLNNLQYSGVNILYVFGSRDDCTSILRQAKEFGMLGHQISTGKNYLWIIHSRCVMSGPPSDELKELLVGQLAIIPTVANTSDPFYKAVVDEYESRVDNAWKLNNGTAIAYVTSGSMAELERVAVPPPRSNKPSFPSLLAFDSLLMFYQSLRSLLHHGIVAPKSNGAILKGIIERIAFNGATGPINITAQTGLRNSFTFNIINPNRTLVFNQVGVSLLEEQRLYGPTESPVPITTTTITAPIQWLGGHFPEDLLNPTDGDRNLSPEAIGLIIGVIVGSLIFTLLCLWLMLASRRKIEKSSDELRRAKEAAILMREKAVNADQAKSQFLSTMSHEIRTPMNGVVGMAALLSSTALSIEQQEYVEGIAISTDHLLTVIDDILDMAKAQSGKLDLEQGAVRLHQVVEQAVNIAYRPAYSSHLELICFIDPSIPFLVVGDQTRLRQIFANLLSNSLKFTKTGHITILVHPAGQPPRIFPLAPVIDPTSPKDAPVPLCPGLYQPDTSRLYVDDRLTGSGKDNAPLLEDQRVTESSQHRRLSSGQNGEKSQIEMSEFRAHSKNLATAEDIEIIPILNTETHYTATAIPVETLMIQCSVEDQGIGVAPEKKDKLFQDFSQVDSSVQRLYGGTGLGLAISHKLAQQMGGNMWCVSREHVGSRFAFTFGSDADPAIIIPSQTSIAHDLDSKNPRDISRSIKWNEIEPGQASKGPTLATTDDHTRGDSLSDIFRFPRLPLPKLNLNILIVDDNIDLLRITASTLSHWKCKVYTATTPMAATKLIDALYPLDEEVWGNGESKEKQNIPSGGFISPSSLDVILVDYHLGGVQNTPPSRLKQFQKTDFHQQADFRASAVSNITPESKSADTDGDPEWAKGYNVDKTPSAKLSPDFTPSPSAQRTMNGLQLCRAISLRLTRYQLAQKNRRRYSSSATNHSKTNNNTIHNNNLSPSPTLPTIRRICPTPPSAKRSRSHLLSPAESLSGQGFHVGLEEIESQQFPTQLLLMVGLTDEGSLQSTPNLESMLSGKLRKPLHESHLLKCLLKVKEAQESKYNQNDSRSPTNLTAAAELSKTFPVLSKISNDPENLSNTSFQINPDGDAFKSTTAEVTLSPMETLTIISAPPIIPSIEQPVSVNSINNNPNNANGNSINHKSGGTAGNSGTPRQTLAEQYPIRILYAEDNPINQRLFSRMLGKFGYQVDIAEHGLKALQMMALKGVDDQYEVVFLDMQMPECDGLTCASHIISLYRESRPRMVAITANAMAKDREACLAAGMDDYIAKPISFPILEQKLIKWGQYVMSVRQAQVAPSDGEGKTNNKQTARSPANGHDEEHPISSEPPQHISSSNTPCIEV